MPETTFTLTREFNKYYPFTDTMIKEFRIHIVSQSTKDEEWKINSNNHFVGRNLNEQHGNYSEHYEVIVLISGARYVITFASRDSFIQYLKSQIELIGIAIN